MKASEIRQMSQDEMHRKIDDLKQELFNLRFQKELKQVENMSKLKQTRRDIARLKTVQREIELKKQ
jgi:large subunit ribosomal protein L29